MSIELIAAKKLLETGLAESTKALADVSLAGELAKGAEQASLQNLTGKFTQVENGLPSTQGGLELREGTENASEQESIDNLRDKFESVQSPEANTTIDASRSSGFDYINPEHQLNRFYVGECDGKSMFEITSPNDMKVMNGPLEGTSIYSTPTQSGNEMTTWTDEYGRVEQVKIDKLELYDGARSEYQQGKCNELKNGLLTDDAGHILAREFGGPAEQFNLTPMDAHTNRHGEWRYMEQEWKEQLKDGKSVTDLEYKMHYDGDSKRASGFDVSYRVDGELESRYIDNSPHK